MNYVLKRQINEQEGIDEVQLNELFPHPIAYFKFNKQIRENLIVKW